MKSESGHSQARVTYLVKQVERGVRTALDRAVREFGLTTPQYAALSVLARRGGLSSAQLARRAFVTPQAMNQIVGQLEAEGLIAREPDPANWRILRASLTREGERRLAACDAVVDDIENRMLHALDPEAVEQLREALLICADELRDILSE
ncbi:MarR family winged helix-turn-helix transcriptional regulator [Streptomyces justiciae]|uniref:MarR family winged helix-turn-helix transcriptional regulator n=1 Tax=Streptomyces justiciae TaxID=2780140 RepID=UPI0021182C52|nr:MarR family transcriptional regulator [Streptomyces justiciae]MCW8378703.1 MarR family transcriptional regulator [Streptomyces justiciae]